MEHNQIYRWMVAHRHPIFLVGLLMFFILPEIIEKVFFFSVPFPFTISFLILSSILLIHTSHRKTVFSYILVGSLVLFLVVWSQFQGDDPIDGIAYVALFIYFAFISFFLYVDLTRSEKVTTSVIIGAFAGYFLIGVLGFFIYAFLELAYPDTLSVDMGTRKGLEDIFYFSFITLTTIGYGDITPTSALGQRFVILQGLIGQFYLAIIMAIMVGKFLSRKAGN